MSEQAFHPWHDPFSEANRWREGSLPGPDPAVNPADFRTAADYHQALFALGGMRQQDELRRAAAARAAHLPPSDQSLDAPPPPFTRPAGGANSTGAPGAAAYTARPSQGYSGASPEMIQAGREKVLSPSELNQLAKDIKGSARKAVDRFIKEGPEPESLYMLRRAVWILTQTYTPAEPGNGVSFMNIPESAKVRGLGLNTRGKIISFYKRADEVPFSPTTWNVYREATAKELFTMKPSIVDDRSGEPPRISPYEAGRIRGAWRDILAPASMSDTGLGEF